MGLLRALLLTLRPRQWVKNLFVVAPLVFGKALGDLPRVLSAGLAFGIFCALSGAVYALNDLLDVEKDRAHPIKRRRPIASGQVPIRIAWGFAFLLAAGALAGALVLDRDFGIVAAAYLVLNVAYSVQLKDLPFVDVGSISLGFLLRVLGGAYAIGVPASRWLMGCTMLLAAFLGFGKRAHELGQALTVASGSSVGVTRRVLSKYRPDHLGWALRLLGALTSIAYLAYTQAPHTVNFFGTRLLALTAPFCVFGIARFLSLVMRVGQADSPTEEMIRDVPFVANLVVWGASVLVIIYVV